jgi:ABC-2 type transport system ATP-binding protein
VAGLVIAAYGLGFSYGPKSILTNLSFSIARGEIVGLLGPNGAGKTTCLRLLAGYMPVTVGKVMLNDAILMPGATLLRQRIGYVAEQAPLYGDLTPQEHIQLALECRRQTVQTTGDALQRFELQGVQHHPVRALSKGYRRRVALAMAFAEKPEVLLLDEPGDGLDPNQKRALGTVLQEAAADTAILLSTHQLEDAERFCSRLLVLHNGLLHFDGTAADLRARATDGALDSAFAALTSIAA